MNFLQLAQFLRQECEISGVGPSTVVAQTGQLKRIVDWVATGYEDIQNKYTNWRWLRKAFTVNTVIGDGEYAFGDCTDVDATGVITRFNHWWAHDECDPYTAYLQASGVAAQYRLIYLPWEEFKWLYRFGTQNNGIPMYVSVDHQNNLCLAPKPDAVYVIGGDFQKGPQVLALDADTPEMPAAYHKLIGYYALEKYGANSVAAEVFARAQLESARLMSALSMNQLPMMGMAGPL